MMRNLGLSLLLFSAGLVATVCVLAERNAAAEEMPTKVRVGLVKSLFHDVPEPVVQIVMRPFKAFLEAQTGATGEIVVTADSAILAQQLKDDQVQIAVFHGFEFAWAKQKNPQLKALVLAVNQTPTQRAVLVVRKDCKAECCGDLKGQTLAYCQMNREHCKLFLENRCIKCGTAPDKFYAEVTSPADCEDALDSVVDGTAQATVVDGGARGVQDQQAGPCQAAQSASAIGSISGWRDCVQSRGRQPGCRRTLQTGFAGCQSDWRRARNCLRCAGSRASKHCRLTMSRCSSILQRRIRPRRPSERLATIGLCHFWRAGSVSDRRSSNLRSLTLPARQMCIQPAHLYVNKNTPSTAVVRKARLRNSLSINPLLNCSLIRN